MEYFRMIVHETRKGECCECAGCAVLRHKGAVPRYELYVMLDVGIMSQIDSGSGWSAVHAIGVQVSR